MSNQRLIIGPNSRDCVKQMSLSHFYSVPICKKRLFVVKDVYKSAIRDPILLTYSLI